jgi:acyl carrier protein
MEKSKKIMLLEEIFEVDRNELNEDVQLSSLETWDSLAALSLVAMIDEKFGKNIAGEKIKSLKTIGDILDLME